METRTKLVVEATKIWCQYGKLICDKFIFEGYLIDATPVERIVNTGSNEQLISFIEFVKNQILVVSNL